MSDKTIPDNEPASPLVDRRYRLLSKLGEGGFGSVYLVEDTWFGNRRLAMKILLNQHLEDEGFLRRFRDEIDVLRSLRHPAISEIVNDGRTSDGTLYFTMEYVEGVVLDALLKAEAPLAPARVLRFVHQLLDVLSAAEERRVVHRDLKPKNIIVEQAGTPDERLKVLDFGIAKVLRPDHESLPGAQATQGIIGTPDYLAPEQIRGGELDTRTDLYAMGIIVHQMLTGQFPFEGATNEARMVARLEKPPRPLPSTAPAALRTLVRALLEVDRDKRPAPSEARRILKPGTPRRRPVVLAGAAVLVAGGIALWTFLQEGGPSQGQQTTPGAVVPVPPDTNAVEPIPESETNPDSNQVPGPDSKPDPDIQPAPGPDIDPERKRAVDPIPDRPVMREYTFSTYPRLGEVYVDGETKNSNENGYFSRSLSAGPHRFLVRADGAEYTLTYVVQRDDVQSKLVIDYANGVVRPPRR